jgi:uncharacterized protein
MLPTLANRSKEIAALCQACGVARLEVFGSATGLDFNPANSDLDLLVTFNEAARARAFDAFFDLREGLEDLFGSRIDLMTDKQIRNPYLAAAVQESRRTIYAA